MAASTLRLALKGVARWAGDDTARTLDAMILWSSGRVRLRRFGRTSCRAEVASESQPGVRYEVTLAGGEWSCECPDHQIRGATCKHIRAVLWTWGSVREGESC